MRIGAISLGCDKNRVDTEKMLSRLVSGGHSLVACEEEAEILIINTCAFIDAAKSESIDEILNALHFKKLSGGNKKVIITGCLSQRYIDELEKEFPEVDAFLGVADYDSIIDTVNKITAGKSVRSTVCRDIFYKNRVLTTPYHYAYLKIADGCDNKCTYCAIPSIRGRYRSESIDNLLKEAEKLSDDGVKELILVAQDVTRYGMDFDGKPHLIELITELEKLDFEWIRLLYLEPEMVTDELLEFISVSKKVVKYADIPFQHISDGVLKRMNRHTDEAAMRALVDKAKQKGITVRSSFICGFPGESEEDYVKLKKFISEGSIDFAGFFAYSREESTPADRLDCHLDDKIKENRVEELTSIQTAVVEARNIKRLGKIYRIIYDGIDYDKQLFKGRAEFQAPDIDNCIYFTADKTIEIGNFYDVEITSTNGLDLIGRIIK